jgi:16S rRNA pseudouridine516 synthase
MEKMRVDKLLSVKGAGTRTEIKKRIAAGSLLLNGTPVFRPETKVDPETDSIIFEGEPVSFAQYEYWVLNKPSGIITATEDRHQKTVIDFMGLKRKGLSPCGRLDKDTEGLLLITDDGDLIHRLLAPGRHVEKTYLANYLGTLPRDAATKVKAGLTLPDGLACLPAVLVPLREENGAGEAEITIHEGKFHQVKRMFEALGCEVTHLKRLSMGPLKLRDLSLQTGEFRRLTDTELRNLLQESKDQVHDEKEQH